MMTEQEQKIADYIARVVATAPPLTLEQRCELSALMGSEAATPKPEAKRQSAVDAEIERLAGELGDV